MATRIGVAQHLEAAGAAVVGDRAGVAAVAAPDPAGVVVALRHPALDRRLGPGPGAAVRPAGWPAGTTSRSRSAPPTALTPAAVSDDREQRDDEAADGGAGSGVTWWLSTMDARLRPANTDL